MRLTETPTEKSPREIGIKKPTAGNQSIDGLDGSRSLVLGEMRKSYWRESLKSGAK
jgi:hypothetical protein